MVQSEIEKLFEELTQSKGVIQASLSDILAAEFGASVDPDADLLAQIGTDSISSIRLLNLINVPHYASLFHLLLFIVVRIVGEVSEECSDLSAARGPRRHHREPYQGDHRVGVRRRRCTPE